MLILTLIEKALNRSISLDPETKARLAALSGKVIHLSIEGLPFPLSMQIHLKEEGFQVEPIDENIRCDVSIKGTLITLAKSGLISSQKIALGEDLIIEGDVALGLQVKAIFDAMEIDWEGHLARFVGNVAAHSIGNIARKTFRTIKSTVQTTQENVSDYIKEEIRITPSSLELNDFLDEIDNLRDDNERLVKRIAQLESTLSGESKS